MRSMTGYGKGTATENGKSFTIELKTVNNRFLEINSRLPKSMTQFDDILRREIQNVIKRGTVDVFFSYENNSQDSKVITIDKVLAAEYVSAAKTLRVEYLLEDDFTNSVLMKMPDVLKIEYSKDDPAVLEKLLSEALDDALERLTQMRKTEGAGIKADLTKLVKNIAQSLKQAAQRAPNVVADYKIKLENRIKELLQSVQVDEVKLINEAAFFADKADISEEISRLSSHIEQFRSTLKSEEQQGRKLDFIAQEMNREINTLGSKSNDIELTSIVVHMKNELEKIKEQIRNVE